MNAVERRGESGRWVGKWLKGKAWGRIKQNTHECMKFLNNKIITG